MTERYRLADTFQAHAPGAEVLFDGTYVQIADELFLGFKNRYGRLCVYLDDSCKTDVFLPVDLYAFETASGIGATILSVEGMRERSKEVQIRTSMGTITMRHEQVCCEVVELVDVVGDPEDLIGGVLVLLEHRTGRRNGKPATRINPRTPRENPLAWRTYTFYEIRTTRGDVTLRWGQPDFMDGNRYGERISVYLT